MNKFVDRLAGVLKLDSTSVSNADKEMIDTRVNDLLDHHLDQISAAHGSNHMDHHTSLII